MYPNLTASLADQRRHDRDVAAAEASRPGLHSPRLLPRIRVTWTRAALAGPRSSRSWVLVISATRLA